MQLVPLIAIHWIEIYPVDSTIQLLNNWGQAQFVHIFAVVARLRHETAEWSRFRLEDVNRRQRFLVPFSNFDTVLKNSTPEKLKKKFRKIAYGTNLAFDLWWGLCQDDQHLKKNEGSVLRYSETLNVLQLKFATSLPGSLILDPSKRRR